MLPSLLLAFALGLPSRHVVWLPSLQIKGEASISTGKGYMELDVWVITKNGRVLFHRRKTHHGKFSFTTPEHPDVDHSRPRNDEDTEEEMYGVEEDNYQVCIEHQDHPDAVHEAGTKRLVSFKLDHSAAYDPSGGHTVAAKAKDVDGVVRALEDMHHTLLSMKNQLDTLHYREKRLAKANEGTNERVAWYSSVGFVVLLLTGAYQSFYMKRYLTSKKIL
ncbi:hypothetical protein I4F81_004204 [Pyropia yezoensis]|uniref:Uncharacterized protein n=1 Tax=Pyropia yezoensis TaxID=2788 RepID=A0ACC3BUQ6_PYRYE|nr:hypothetical protein I4F81_004204 [Neopyropia yezoensis]